MCYSIKNETASTEIDDDVDTTTTNNNSIKCLFFQVVMKWLAGKTPSMISAFAIALSHLMFEVARSDDAAHA